MISEINSNPFLLIQILNFLAAALIVAAVAILLFRRDFISERLSRLLSSRKERQEKKPSLLEKEHGGWVAKVTRRFDSVARTDELAGGKVRRKLMQAGFRSRWAFRNLILAKTLLALALPGLYLLGNAFIRISPEVLAISLLLACVGFFLPNLYILHRIQKRKESIQKGLPDALDLMVVCVESGLGLDMTFRRVGLELLSLSPDLSDEFHLTNREILAGKSREESLRNMSLRTDVREVRNLMTVLIQTNRFGTSLAKALRVHADAMRVRRRQNAEEKAAKCAVKLVFPLACFIFPAIFVVLAGPAAIRIVKALFPVLGG